ncbi:hypothetical protein J121_958 [Qipengyuania citrea LAMA 915]|uniref:Uncharacterized protein n=1 Tax=Qipengyuania citrea LAMA 915 TaxID=1306953 RepID=A0A0L1KG91_9SPHN|nr:hypothetical protein J121_958 [Qipengyuania citrea LAMA 915]
MRDCRTGDRSQRRSYREYQTLFHRTASDCSAFGQSLPSLRRASISLAHTKKPLRPDRSKRRHCHAFSEFSSRHSHEPTLGHMSERSDHMRFDCAMQ